MNNDVTVVRSTFFTMSAFLPIHGYFWWVDALSRYFVTGEIQISDDRRTIEMRYNIPVK